MTIGCRGPTDWYSSSEKSPEDYRTKTGQRPEATRIVKWYNDYSGKIKEKPEDYPRVLY